MRSLHPWPTFPLNLDLPSARSLSILFILKEWIRALEIIEQMKTAPLNVSFLLKELEKILLFSLSSPLNQQGGSLDKICFYCDNLLQASKVRDESVLMILEEMRTAILSCKNTLLRSKHRPSPAELAENEKREISALLETKFCQFFFAFVSFLQEARTDENILVYLIEQKQTLNRFLGPRSIEIILRNFFPTGHAHLRAVICEGLTRRGFTSFFAEKEALIEELEWDSPCHPPAMTP